ncbi:unnamed protein product [Ascophyllum nodosum]
MLQTNVTSRFTRKVRRNVDVTRPCNETWLWKNGSAWEPLPIRVCHQMVASRDYRRESSTVVHLFGTVYQFFPAQQLAVHQQSGDHLPLRAVANQTQGSAGGGVASGAVPMGNRTSEFQQIIDAGTDCTATVSEDETCAVCIDGFDALQPALLLAKCNGHFMHPKCVIDTFTAMGPKCPTCSTMYGTLLGDQPDGTMTVRTHRAGAMPLEGYESVGTIVIQYHFPSGTQGPRHPNTGRRYHGTSRIAYLPDNPEGRQVLELFRKSFDQRMTFTVGTSITTGRSDCVVWNGVHHKTNVSGGSSNFGYPDSDYFTRVKAELATKGIC